MMNVRQYLKGFRKAPIGLYKTLSSNHWWMLRQRIDLPQMNKKRCCNTSLQKYVPEYFRYWKSKVECHIVIF